MSVPRTASRPEISREVLGIVEINADERIVAGVSFDLDDFDAAIAELDSRYLAGEAAAHAHTWSVITQAYAAFNRHEVPPTTPDCVNIDHRRRADDAVTCRILRATWELTRRQHLHRRELCIG